MSDATYSGYSPAHDHAYLTLMALMEVYTAARHLMAYEKIGESEQHINWEYHYMHLKDAITRMETILR